MEKSSKHASLPLVLFEFSDDFNDSVFGVGTLSSIFKPPLPDSLSESVLVVHSWISDNEQLTIRWHKRTKNNWNDKIYGSNSTEGPDDEFRCGRPRMLSEDKDFLKKNLLQLKKKSLSKDVTQHSNNASKGKRSTTSKPNTTTSSSAAIATKSKPLSLNQTAREDDDHTKKTRSRRHLDFYQAESAACIGGKENDEDQTTSTSLEKDDSARIKRRLEQENDELKKKVARLENEKEEERKILNGQITELEIQLNTLEEVCKEKTNEVSGLNDTLEKMHSNQLLPTVLIQHITGLIDVIKADSEKRQAELSRLQSMKLTTVPASAVSTPCSSPHATPSKRLVKLDGDVFIDRDALKNAVAYGSTANTDHNLNLMINTILDAFFTQSQLAGYSLSGKACPNMKGSKPKPKIPSNIIQALKNFVRRNWKEWYKVVPTDKAINSGVGAKLRSCHTAAKNKGKKSSLTKQPLFIGDNDSEDDNGNSKGGVDDNEDNISVRSSDFENEDSSSQAAEENDVI